MKRSLPTLAALILTSATVAAQVPAGGEFRVNSFTPGYQDGSAAAFDRNGNFVVVWTTRDANAEGAAQRFDAAGMPIGGEFLVNAGTAGAQQVSKSGTPIAMRPDGRFVVVWKESQITSETVRGQRFEAGGGRAGAEFEVAASTSYMGSPNVAITPHGTFVVAWWRSGGSPSNDWDVWGQMFDAGADRMGTAFRVNTDTTGHQSHSRVAIGADGSFVVVWTDRSHRDGSGDGVFGQRFAPDGARLGGEFQVNTYTTDNQIASSVARAADGRFVVAFESYEEPTGITPSARVRRYDANGTPAGPDFLINETLVGGRPTVATDRNFNVVAAWYGQYGIHARRFDSQGAPRGAEFQAATYTTDTQDRPNVAMDSVGNFLVTWDSWDQEGPSSKYGVYAQRFGGLVPTALRVDTSDNEVLEPGETTDVRPTWRNVNGAAVNFAGGLSSPTGPAGGVPGIVAPFAAYGTVPNGVSVECSPCYRIVIPDPSPRPARHWDGAALETITPGDQGQLKTWLLHVGDSFADVAVTNPFYQFVEALLHHGVTSGCAVNTYCPAGGTARDQMAVFVLVAREGAGYVAPACGVTPMFADVPVSSPFCRWVEELARRGITVGCGGGNFCPASAVSREQMAVFVLRTLEPALIPSACVPPNLFADVPETSPFCPWVEELANRGVVTGCGGSNYCPTASVTREQMSVFLSVTFGLALYGL